MESDSSVISVRPSKKIDLKLELKQLFSDIKPQVQLPVKGKKSFLLSLQKARQKI
jgi:hypothetical protein